MLSVLRAVVEVQAVFSGLRISFQTEKKMLEIGMSHLVKTQFSVSINDLEMCMYSRNPEKLVKHGNENLLIKKIQPL